MKLTSSTFLIWSLFSLTVNAQPESLKDQADRIGYVIGHQIGMDYKRQNVELDEISLRQGLEHGEQDITPRIDKKTMHSMLVDLKRNITATMKQDAITKIEKRRLDEQQKREDGVAFMQQNRSRPDVTTLPSGLQYRVLSDGQGNRPEVDDYVTFNYRAKTLDGKEYDSSYKKGGPSTYRANAVLPGFTEAIQMMSPGSRWELYLPPEQAYGRQGPLAHQTIVLDVELLAVDRK